MKGLLPHARELRRFKQAADIIRTQRMVRRGIAVRGIPGCMGMLRLGLGLWTLG